MGNDVCFSGSALTLVGGLLSALTVAIGALFKALLAAKDQQAKDKDDQLADLWEQIKSRDTSIDTLQERLWQAVQALNEAQKVTGAAVDVARRRRT